MSGRSRDRARTRCGGTTFLPTQLTGCALWLRADRGVTESALAVSSWQNYGTLGGTFDQGTAGAKPAFAATGGSNSQASLTFDGGDFLTSSLSAASWNFLHSSAFTVFSVFRQTATGNAFYGLLSTSTTVASSRGIGVYWDNRSALPVTANLRTAVANGSTYVINPSNSGIDNGFAANAWSALEARYEAGISGDDFATLRNGTSIKTAETGNAASGSNAANTLLIGCLVGATSNGLVGGMSEVIAFNRALSADDRWRVRRYLGTRYALTVV